jgi:hypothetical protein
MRTPVYYDTVQRRLWISGQRCHHGATGALLAALGFGLMLHDWKDRTEWFPLIRVPPAGRTLLRRARLRRR